MAATPPKPPPPTDVRLIRLMRRAALLARATLLDDTELSSRDRARVTAGIIKPGTTESAKKHNKARAAAQLRDLGKELRALNIQADAILDESIRGAYQRGARDADRLARAAGLVDAGSPIGGALSGAETRRAAVLVRRAQADVGKAFKSVEAITGRAVRQARALGLNNEKVSRILAGGTITGQSPLVIQQLRKHLQQISIDGFVEVPTRTGGVIRFKPDYYADLVYQTAMAEAHNIAELERLIAREAYYVQIIGSNSTNFCTAFVGKVFYIGPGEDPLGLYPHVRTLPRGGAPFHPRCTKRYVPFNPKLATPAEIEAGRMDEQTGQLLEKSPAEAEKVHQEAQAEPKTPDSPPPEQPADPTPRPAEPITRQPTEPLRRETRPAETPDGEPITTGLVDAAGQRIAEIEVARPDTVESVVRAVERVRDRNLPTPPIFRDDPETFDFFAHQGGVVAAYDPIEQAVLVNPDSPFWPGIQAVLLRRRKENVISSDDLDHVILNEIGHHVHLLQVGSVSLFRKLRAARFDSADRAAVEAEVSIYAASNPQEFVAEVFAAMIAGRRFSRRIMALYRRFGGGW